MQLGYFFTLLQMHLLISRASAGGKRGVIFEVGIGGDKSRRFSASGFDQLDIFQCFHRDVGDAPLLAAREFARAAEREIVFGEFEAVFRVLKSSQPFLGRRS